MDSTGASVLWACIALQRGMLDVRGKLEEIGRDKIPRRKVCADRGNLRMES